jgi:succinate dehydrogenase hydrophobic anchor subunit
VSPAGAAPVTLGSRPRRGGLWPWLLQRVSGLFLVYALAVHLWAVHVVSAGRLSWDTITARLQDGNAWTVYYLLFIPAVVYHAANGLWGVFLDYNPPTALRRGGLLVLWAGSLALLAYGYVGIRALL